MTAACPDKMGTRLLVVGPAWVGDMVMAQSLFKTLRQGFPEYPIDVLAPSWSLPLLQRMPEVEEMIPLPIGHGELALGKRLQLGRSLRGRYAWAILLPNSWKSALVPWAARIPRRTGWLGELRYGLLNDWRRLDKGRLTMTVQRFVALAYPAETASLPPIPRPRLHVSAENIEAALGDLGLPRPQRPLLALCPGAEYGPAKRWPTESYAALGSQMHHLGWDVWLFGSGKDREVCSAITAAAPGIGLDLSGRTSLAQAIDLLALAQAVVSNDSGLMHVAAALDRPLVALYGSSDPGFTPPLSDHARIIHLGLDCSPCFRRHCPLGHLDCLRGISVDRVRDVLLEMTN